MTTRVSKLMDSIRSQATIDDRRLAAEAAERSRPFGERGGGMQGLFRGLMEQTGGADGDASTEASWTYTVKTLGGETIATDFDPTVATPDAYRRPSLGKVVKATRGVFAFEQGSGDGAVLVCYDCNEIEDIGACSGGGGGGS